MPLDPSYAGRTYPPTEPYRVGREKIREFASAIGATDPAYHDPDRIELSKFCPRCRKHTAHRETR